MAQQQNDTEQAMNRVLEAEREAHAAITECAARAAALIDAAQQQARRVHARTDTRISQVHAHCALALGQQVETLLRQEPHSGAGATPDAAMRELLTAAVTCLAASLTDGTGADD